MEVGPGEYDIKSTVPQLPPFEARAMNEAAYKISLE